MRQLWIQFWFKMNRSNIRKLEQFKRFVGKGRKPLESSTNASPTPVLDLCASSQLFLQNFLKNGCGTICGNSFTERPAERLMLMMRGSCGTSLIRRPADADDARDSLMLMMRRFCESGSAQRPADADDVRLLFDQGCTETS